MEKKKKLSVTLYKYCFCSLSCATLSKWLARSYSPVRISIDHKTEVKK
jgi:hypothetical protein